MKRHALALLLSSAIASMIAPAFAGDPISTLAREVADGEHRGIDAIAIARDREVLAIGRRDRLRTDDIDIRSATKSITALLVGIAIDRGLIPSVDTPVATLLPELSESFADPVRARMRLRDLLTMRSGLDCDDWRRDSPGHEDTMYKQKDWLAFWAAVPMRESPGERFSYCTGNVVALGRILANATGKPVPDYARDVLFEPLGILDARWATWNSGRDTDTGGHLAIPPDGLLAIGRLVSAGGMWDGRRIVGSEWIDAMTTPHTDIPGLPQRYGYLWWLDETRDPALPRTRLLMAWGNGGNFLVVMPELSLVYVSVGKRYNKPDALEPLQWLRDKILPALKASADSAP